MQINHHVVTCGHCGATTEVTVHYWPATRVDPEDGESDVGECSGCGREFDDETTWADNDPPEQEPDERWDDDPARDEERP